LSKIYSTVPVAETIRNELSSNNQENFLVIAVELVRNALTLALSRGLTAATHQTCVPPETCLSVAILPATATGLAVEGKRPALPHR
jgi:hypothetical protein